MLSDIVIILALPAPFGEQAHLEATLRRIWIPSLGNGIDSLDQRDELTQRILLLGGGTKRRLRWSRSGSSQNRPSAQGRGSKSTAEQCSCCRWLDGGPKEGSSWFWWLLRLRGLSEHRRSVLCDAHRGLGWRLSKKCRGRDGIHAWSRTSGRHPKDTGRGFIPEQWVGGRRGASK